MKMKKELAKLVENLTISNLRSRIASLIPDSKNRYLILDCGCGEHGSWNYFGKASINVTTDFESVIDDTRVVYGVDKKFGTNCDNLSKFKTGYFNCVILSGVIQYVSNPHKALREISRVLGKEGILIIATVNNDCLWRRMGIISRNLKSDELHMYTKSDMTNLLNSFNHGSYILYEETGVDFIPLPAGLCSNMIIKVGKLI